jgi:nucleosome binding factor SPN SPT16 subunit
MIISKDQAAQEEWRRCGGERSKNETHSRGNRKRNEDCKEDDDGREERRRRRQQKHSVPALLPSIAGTCIKV